MSFFVSEFAGFKNTLIFLYKKKKNFIVLLTGGEGVVKALAECPSNNASFLFYVFPKLKARQIYFTIFFSVLAKA